MKSHKPQAIGVLEVIVVVAIMVALVLLAFFTARVHGLLLVDVDQQSHLNFARLVTDSLTPGVSQLGFWPPLLHAVLAPFAFIDTLYFSGAAALFAVLPFYFLAAFFLFSIVRTFTKSVNPAIFATLLFATSPYILYYSVTPMMEIPFIALALGSLYFLQRWLAEGKLAYILLASFFVSLSILARFEGFALIPGLVLVFLYRSFKERTSVRQGVAVTSLILPLLFGGIALILLYGTVYGSGPLEFLHGKWSAFAQEKFLELPSQGSITQTLLYFLAALRSILGSDRLLEVFAAFTLGSFVISLVAKERRAETMLLGLYSFLPTLFVLYSMYAGHTVIYSHDLPPYKEDFNIRYGLVLLPPVVLWSSVFLHAVHKNVWKPLALLLGWGMVFLSILFSFQNISAAFPLISQSTKNVQPWNQEQSVIAKAICQNDDGASLTLFTRATMNNVPIAGCLPLSRFIVESNDPYYDMAIERPWLFAEHVIVLKKGINAFAYESDRVTQVWGESSLLSYFYDKEEETNRIVLYRLKKDAVRTYAQYFFLNIKAIPTLTTEKSAVLSRDVYTNIGIHSAEELVARDAEFLSAIKK